MFRPFRCFIGYTDRVPHTHDILLLGNQPLTALRDKIVCLGDEVVPSECHGIVNPEGPHTKMKVNKLFAHVGIFIKPFSIGTLPISIDLYRKHFLPRRSRSDE